MKKFLIIAFILALGMIWIDNPTKQEITNTGTTKMGGTLNLNQALGSGGLKLSPGQPITPGGGLTYVSGPPIYNPSFGGGSSGGGGAEYGGGGGGGASGGGTYSAPAPDPYAQWGGKAAYDSQVSGFDTQKNNVIGSAHDAAAISAGQIHGNILDFLVSLRASQRKVNNRAVQNELSKKQGVRGVLGMVSRGIRSGGVMLANKNASDSSATEGIANAYGQIGRQNLSNVNNQYVLGQNEVDQMQQDLEDQRGQGLRHINESKNQIVNNIVLDARDKLAQLDAQIANASLPNRIAIDQEKERVRQDALGQLQQYDSELAQGSAGIQGSSLDDRRSEGLRLANAGTAPDSAFNYTDQAPANWQGQGPAGGNLPLFTFNRNTRRDQLA